MRKRNPKNERIKRRYIEWLEEAKSLSPQSTDPILASILAFEESTDFRDFAAFHIEQARRFKRLLGEARNERTGRPLSQATIRSRLMALKAFFQWLASQPGYRRIKYADAEYFNISANENRIATARRERPAPELEQVHKVIAAMPANSPIEKRDRALIAVAILTGARDDALASFSLKHIDVEQRLVHQDARDVRTKFRKSFPTWFFPVGGQAEAITRDWIEFLRKEYGFGSNDPLFPQTEMGLDAEGQFVPIGLTAKHWSDAGAIRRIFRAAFEAAGLPYFHPHSFRTTLARLGLKLTTTEEEWSTWSLNLGHENVATTFKSYATVPIHRRAEVMRRLGEPRPTGTMSKELLSAIETLRSVKI
jgi:integrase